MPILTFIVRCAFALVILPVYVLTYIALSFTDWAHDMHRWIVEDW